jgi:hypothetical protein
MSAYGLALPVYNTESGTITRAWGGAWTVERSAASIAHLLITGWALGNPTMWCAVAQAGARACEEISRAQSPTAACKCRRHT